MQERVVQLVLKARDEASRTTKKFGISLDDLSLKQAGLAAATTATAVAVVAGLKKSVRSAQEYEQAMAEVRTLTNANAADHRKLSNEVRDLAVRYGELDTVMARAAYNVVSAGFGDAAEQVMILDVASRAATAGVTDVNTAAMLLTQSLNAYGEGADQAAYYSDILFQTVKGGVTTFPELAAHLGKVTATASTVGITFEEVASAIAVMTKKGISTAEAATALNGLLVAISAGGPEAKAKLDALGITLDNGLAPALARLDEVGGGALDVLKELVPNVRALKAASSAGADGARDLTAQIDASRNSAGATDEAFTIMNATAQASEDRLKAMGRAFETSVGEAFLAPKIAALDNLAIALGGVTKGAVGVINAVNWMNDTWGKFYSTTGNAEQLASLGFMIDEQGKVVAIAAAGLADYTKIINEYFAALAADAGGEVPFRHLEDMPAQVDVAKGKLDELAAYWGVMLESMEVDPETGIMALVPKDNKRLAEEIKAAYDAAMVIIAAGPPEIPIAPKIVDAATGDEFTSVYDMLLPIEGEGDFMRGIENLDKLINKTSDLEDAARDAAAGIQRVGTSALSTFLSGSDAAIMFGRQIRQVLIAAVSELIVRLLVAKALAIALSLIPGAGSIVGNTFGALLGARGGTVPRVAHAAAGYAIPATGQRGMDSVLIAGMPGEEVISRGLSMRLGRFLARAENSGMVDPGQVAMAGGGGGDIILQIGRPMSLLDSLDLGDRMEEVRRQAAAREVG